jgi:uncharacterized RDD family membrane protein YckC
MLDTVKTAETPEGVELQLTCAGFYVRGVAWFLDALIQMLLIIALSFSLPFLGEFGLGLFFIALFFIQWFYPVFFEVFNKGQTPGKKAMKIQVVFLDGTMVNWGASLLRNLLRTVDFLPFFYALGLMVMLLSKDFRRLGDLAANTIVVYKHELKHKKQVPEVQPYAPKIALSANEQQMIVNYAERFKNFSPERAEELARLATPLLEDLPTTSQSKRQLRPASERLLAVANYLMGRR